MSSPMHMQGLQVRETERSLENDLSEPPCIIGEPRSTGSGELFFFLNLSLFLTTLNPHNAIRPSVPAIPAKFRRQPCYTILKTNAVSTLNLSRNWMSRELYTI